MFGCLSRLAEADSDGNKIFPDDGQKQITILQRHHYRDCPENLLESPAYHITYQDIMKVVRNHDGIRKKQRLSDGRTSVDQDNTFKHLIGARAAAVKSAKRTYDAYQAEVESKGEEGVAAKKQRIGE
jgi:hypothetical protein